MFTGGVRFHKAVVLLIQVVVVACVIYSFVVYFRVYIHVRLIMLGYLFFCIYFNVLCITCYPK